jgi:hypothetical protein
LIPHFFVPVGLSLHHFVAPGPDLVQQSFS